jgi:SAM-dependent methyltransferase
MAGAQLSCWCSHREWEVCFRKRSFGLVRCRACGTYRIDPPAVGSNEGLATFYTSYYDGPKPAAAGSIPDRPGSRFWKVSERVPQLKRAGGRALDIGCGDGALCAELKAAGWNSVTGLDISKSRIARARERHPGLEFFDVPLDTAGIPPAAFDLAVMDNVVEHLPDPVAQLEQIRRYLTASGTFIMITPNMESGHFRFLGSRWTAELAPHVHIFLFTPSSLTRLAEAAGYRVWARGSFDLDPYPVHRLIGRFVSGDVKGALWKAHQEAGSIYSRLIGSGPMIYVAASPEQQREPFAADTLYANTGRL